MTGGVRKKPVQLRLPPCTSDYWGLVGCAQEFTKIMSGYQSMSLPISPEDTSKKARG